MTWALLLVAGVAAAAAALTLFSGFGLGTVLLPVFSLFFPVPLAVALTGVVHFLNNVFKIGMLRRDVDWGVVWRFGLVAIPAAWLGAMLLGWLSARPPLGSYALGGHAFHLSPVKLAIGGLLVAFALFELLPEARLPTLSPRLLPLGGVLSGFFGGLSGNQGALRSVFLLNAGLSKEAYVATGAAIALMVDLTRLTTYAVQLRGLDWARHGVPTLVACVAAFLGTWVGGRVLPHVTYQAVRRLTATLLIALGLGLGAGLL